MNSFDQYHKLLKQSFCVEKAEPQRVLSSLLFAFTMVFLFSFAVDEIPPVYKMQFILAEVFLCIFLVLQIVHQRILATEEQDRAIDILISSPLSFSVFYIVKVTVALCLSGVIIFPFLAFMQILHGVSLWNLSFICIVLLVIFSLSAMGVLLSQMTERASGRDLLFPLLYFPLTIPVLLSAVQASFCYWEIRNAESLNLWLGLLCVFSVVYFTLGVLLFEELIGLD